MLYCTKCGSENQDDYSFCFKCGTPKNTTSGTVEPVRLSEFNSKPDLPKESFSDFGDKSIDASLSASIQKVFSYIDEAGGVNLPNYKKLSSGKAHKIDMNYWAWFFGFFYLIIKGMWRQSITRFFIACGFMIAVAAAEAGMKADFSNSMWTVLNIVISGMCFGWRINLSYYKMKRLGLKPWF